MAGTNKYEEYARGFIEIIDSYQQKKGLWATRRLYTKLWSAHDHGIDLVTQLDDNGFTDLSKSFQEFQKEWEKNNEGWTISFLDHIHIQALAEKMGETIIRNRGKNIK